MPFPPTPSQTASNTPTPSITPSVTPSFSPTGTVCPGLTPTSTSTPNVTPSQTMTQTVTPSNTPSVTQTMTQTPSQTATFGFTPTNTSTPSQTPSQTMTQTPSPSVCALDFSLTYTCNETPDATVYASGFTCGSGQYDINQVLYLSQSGATSGIYVQVNSSVVSYFSVPNNTWWVCVRDRNNPSNKVCKSITPNC